MYLLLLLFEDVTLFLSGFHNFQQTVSFNSCCCSVTRECLTLCSPMDCSTPGFPALHHLPEFAQTHVHWVGDAIQPSHPLSLPSPPAFNLSQHQGLFQWVDSSYQVAKGFELQHQFFQWIFRVYLLWDWLIWSPCCPGDSQESSPAPWFKSINSSVLSFLYSPAPTSITILLGGWGAMLWGIQDLNSLTRYQTCDPCSGNAES